jgi:hypothetical protein
MFFYLGENCRLLDKQSEHVFTDLGWSKIDDVYYKGYCLDYDIHTNIEKIIQGDKPQGIYCVVKNNQLYHSSIRPFPLYQQGSTFTNLKLENYVELENNKYKLPTSEKSFDTVVKELIDIIAGNLSKFELNIWCTGGIDSTMLIAIAEFAKLNYTIHIAKPDSISTDIKTREGTVESYQSELLDFCRTNYWAYELLSVFQNKIITTGFYGDNFFCRTVWQIKMLLSALGLSLHETVKPNHYIFKYMLRNIRRAPHLQFQDINFNIDNVKSETIALCSSPQVWHFDKTITFCPLFDERIANSVWSLDIKTLLDSALDATIQREIILNTKPDVLLLLDKHKNDQAGRKNFFSNIEKVKLPHCTNIVVY